MSNLALRHSDDVRRRDDNAAKAAAPSAFVSVIIPCRNERRYITACLDSLIASDYPKTYIEILIVDGMSNDGTREIIAEYVSRYSFVKMLDNPKKVTPAALNLGIAASTGEIVLRADGHTLYPPDYIGNCVRYLEMTGADNVGGPCITMTAEDGLGSALVAAILSSAFGVGNAQFRIGQKEGPVDTVPFGAFRRSLFGRIGGFNEQLLRNQDNEFNARIRASGGTVFQTPRLTTRYFPPATLNQLLRKTVRESQWHAFTTAKNWRALRIRHFVPAAFVLGIGILGVGSLFSGIARIGLIAVLAVYILAAVYFSIRIAAKRGLQLLPLLPFAFLAFHVCYGAGTLAGLPMRRGPGQIPYR